MAGKLIRTSCFLAKYSTYQKLLKTTILGINVSANYCHSKAAISKSSEDAKPLNAKKTNKSNNVLQGNVSNTLNKTVFYEIGNEVEVSSPNSQNLEAKNSTKEDLFEEKIVKIKNQIFSHSLASYISVCTYSGLHNSAFATFKHYRNLQANSKDAELLDLKPYNEILKGIASEGDLNKMREVMIYLEESSLKPDYNTIAYCLTCLGRNENTPIVIDEIKRTLELMEHHKITFDEILSKSFFPGDSIKSCFQAIERVIPNIKDKETLYSSKDYILKENCYQNKLVKNLNNFIFTNKVKSHVEGVIPPDKFPEIIQRQIDNELSGYIEVPKCSGKGTMNHEDETKLWEEWTEEWRKELSKALDKYKNFMSKKFSDPKSSHVNEFPYLNVLDNEDIIELLLQEVKCLCSAEFNFMSYNQMAYYLGHKCYNRFEIRYKENTRSFSKLKEIYEKYCNWYLHRSDTDSSYIPRVEWNKILAKENQNMNWKDKPIEWPDTVKLAIGLRLHKFIFENLKVWTHEETPKKAFQMFRGNKSNNVIMKPAVLLMKIFDVIFENMLIFPTTELPMLSPPVPWTDLNNGPFLFTSCNFARAPGPKYQMINWLEEEKMPKLYPMFDCVNAAGSIPWKINCNMLDTIIEVFNKDGCSRIGIFEAPFSESQLSKLTEGSTDIHDEINKKKNYRIERDSWIGQLKRLSIANYYRNSVFWVPHCVDFRSRAHPVGPHLSQFRPDVYRSLLLFAQGKKLGKDGLTWLKLHIVNLTGMKKQSSIEDRLKYCEEVMDEIFDSAKNPLTGNLWWRRSDEPWQTLAACKEFVAALESECPEEYVSHFPIHQDGYCNGLQHFAALGRDKEGAESVNLRPFDTPQDVYCRNIELLEKIREEDARKGDQTAQVLKRFLNRKLIKNAVLSNVYGITETSGFNHLVYCLRDQHGFPDDYDTIGMSAEYLSKATFKTLGITFPALKPIKDWLFKVVDGTSEHCLSTFEYESPLGFPVSQPNAKEEVSYKWPVEIISSFIQGSVFSKPDPDYQKRSLGPNFIQSLEASHMILTSLHCHQAGIFFATVHDSYWTHPSTVTVMSKICREQFVRLYSQPILENLAESFIKKFSTHQNYNHYYTTLSEEDSTPASLEVLLKNVPKKGDFDLNEVQRSTFFFS